MGGSEAIYRSYGIECLPNCLGLALHACESSSRIEGLILAFSIFEVCEAPTSLGFKPWFYFVVLYFSTVFTRYIRHHLTRIIRKLRHTMTNDLLMIIVLPLRVLTHGIHSSLRESHHTTHLASGLLAIRFGFSCWKDLSASLIPWSRVFRLCLAQTMVSVIGKKFYYDFWYVWRNMRINFCDSSTFLLWKMNSMCDACF